MRVQRTEQNLAHDMRRKGLDVGVDGWTGFGLVHGNLSEPTLHAAGGTR